ncbi:hypothetical protein GHK92_18075 [Nocardioides sp. dk4132]|uniref:hypothetical protein n=1 Tax=unclassified Nocardioides TaxID=2615069 RepID=UPI001294B45F|nr:MULTISPECIES: hypothetical protein [unclassified Nocardioides]MQW77783.1 hypothetical protein [Nocardioides sp. dk4132]QGA07036.1 hypothetical protein GFH29_06295 [Nocardioides sp. dk884]
MSRVRAAAALLAGLLCLAPLTAAPPASAATCTDGRGVSVVVDFGALGGGLQESCDADGGGKKATAIFADSGVELTYAQRSAGFVCRVEGVPSSDPCINAAPADAYWGLWWSDGETGTWVYASLGTSSLTVPDGGSVAFSWNSGTRTQPGVAPPVAAAAAPTAPSSPRATPSHGTGGTRPGPGGGADAAQPAPSDAPSAAAGTGTPSTAATPGADPSGTPAREPRRTDRTAAGGPSATAATPGAEEPAESTEAVEESAATADDGGLPGWVVLVVLALVFGGAGVVAVRRRGTAGR